MFGALASSFFVIELAITVLISEHGGMWVPAAVGGVPTVLGGVLGGIVGIRFIDWMSDNWHRVHR